MQRPRHDFSSRLLTSAWFRRPHPAYCSQRPSGQKRAAELLFFGDPFSAEDTHAAGLVNAVITEGTVVDHALERARELALKPPSSLSLTKALLKAADTEAVARTMQAEGTHFIEALTGPEAQEALAAFIEKRPPDFSQFD